METSSVSKVSVRIFGLQIEYLIMKSSITKSACESFLKLGFKSVTMDDIAAKLAISKKTLYKYFKNKEALVKAASTEFHTKVSEVICNIMQENFNAIEESFRIKQAVNAHLMKSRTSPMYQLQKYYPKIYNEFFNKEYGTFEMCVMHNLEKGISEGLYRSDFDKENILKFYFLLVRGIHESEFFNRELFTEGDLGQIALEYHIRAIATEKGINVLEEQLEKLKN